MSLFFSNNPTYIIEAGLSYCLGGFGTQLSPNPANGQPVTPSNPVPGYTPPYAPWPPPQAPGLASFVVSLAVYEDAPPNQPEYLYSDGSQYTAYPGTAFGALVSGGGTGGAVLNQVYYGGYDANLGPGKTAATFGLTLSLPGDAPPPQNFFHSIWLLYSGEEVPTEPMQCPAYQGGPGTGPWPSRYTTAGNSATWQWQNVDDDDNWVTFTNPDIYTVT